MFKNLFKNSSHKIHEKPVEEPIKEKSTRPNVFCKGSYSFKIVKNEETEEEYEKRGGDIERYFGWTLPYYSHCLHISYNFTIKEDNFYFITNNEFFFRKHFSEQDCFLEIYNIIQGGKQMEELKQELISNLRKDLDAEKNREKIGFVNELLENNKFDIELSFEEY